MSQTNKLKKRKAKSPMPLVDSSVGASTSATASGDSRGGITTEDVLQNTSILLEVLKSVSDAAQILSPLKAVCGVLKIAVDTAIVRNYIQYRENLRILVLPVTSKQWRRFEGSRRDAGTTAAIYRK
jgi:hypothetical protein